MPNKTQEYLNLAQQTAKELTRYWENWTDYLTTASRLYKYNLADQLMIYAQRPDATACASFDIWNNRMNRYVRRGSKGIALLWNGKTPEEFTEADAYRFMAETEAVLQRKELMDDPAQPAPASGKEEFYLSKKDDVLLTPEQIAAEERRWLFDAPIAELAEVKGVSIDEAVKMRTDAVLQEAVVPITVSVRPIEPQGKLIGFASVNFGGVVIDDFKVVDGKNGIFLGAPSKPDPASRTGYRATVRIPDRATQERINAAGVEAYHAAVEQLVARAQAVRPAPIKEQMAEAAKQAGKENAARPAPAKAKEARNDR